MNIYTRTGDDGMTGMADGRRVEKDSPAMEFCGTIDELNSLLGVVRTQNPPPEVDAIVERIQSELFLVGAEVACAGQMLSESSQLGDRHIHRLEADIDELNAQLPSLTSFILPGGAPATASLHVARTVCRRAERRLVTLARQVEHIRPIVLVYLNRLSDLLFVAARSADRQKSA